MPIYEYECRGCGHAFEEWQKMSDPPVRKCPKCSARKVERLVSVSSFQLKGGGWYVTDYGKGNSGSRTSRESSDSAGSKASKKGGSSTKASASSNATS